MQVGQADAVRPQQAQAQPARLRHQRGLARLAVRPGFTETVRIDRHDLRARVGACRQQRGHLAARNHHEDVVHRPGQAGQRRIGPFAQDVGAGGVDGIDGAGIAVLAHEPQGARGVLAHVSRSPHQGNGAGGQQRVGKGRR
ncbi:hypothetical protein D3C72_1643120 [compost metagenome]